jgi:hypothetical protein
MARQHHRLIGSDRQQPTPCCHSIQISEWQHTHGKPTVDSSEPTGNTDQNRPINLFIKRNFFDSSGQFSKMKWRRSFNSPPIEGDGKRAMARGQ